MKKNNVIIRITIIIIIELTRNYRINFFKKIRYDK